MAEISIIIKKKYKLIIIKLANAAKTNAIIEKNIIKEYDIKTCELFDKNYKVT